MAQERSISEEVEKTLAALDGIAPAELPPFFYTRLSGRLEQGIAKAEKGWSVLLQLSVAACFLLLALNGWSIWQMDAGENIGAQSAPAGVEEFAEEYGLDVSTTYQLN